MVTTRKAGHGKLVKKLTKAMVNNIFGKNTLILRKVAETLDAFGQLSSSVNVDVTFTGDLQFGLDIDERLIKIGMVEIGDAVLYIEPDALSPLPQTEDLILDGASQWEIESQIEKAELGGVVTHYSYRCKRRIESDDN